MADPTDFPRLLGDLLTIGIVASVDNASGTAMVDIGEIRTSPLNWTTTRAGGARIWCPPVVGEQVLVLSPEGDLEGGLIVASLSYDRFPAPASDASTRIEFDNGTWIGFNPGTGDLTAIIASGSATIEAPGGIRLVGPVSIEGDVAVTGRMQASDDVVGGSKSLKDHTHSAVQPGGGFSGPPR